MRMGFRVVVVVLCAIVFGPALARILRGRKRLQHPEQTILIYRNWEGQ